MEVQARLRTEFEDTHRADFQLSSLELQAVDAPELGIVADGPSIPAALSAAQPLL